MRYFGDSRTFVSKILQAFARDREFFFSKQSGPRVPQDQSPHRNVEAALLPQPREALGMTRGSEQRLCRRQPFTHQGGRSYFSNRELEYLRDII